MDAKKKIIEVFKRIDWGNYIPAILPSIAMMAVGLMIIQAGTDFGNAIKAGFAPVVTLQTILTFQVIIFGATIAIGGSALFSRIPIKFKER